VPVPEPGPGQVRVRVHYAGVNFIDVYHRTGLYALERPFTPGSEAAGEVDAVGPGVSEFRQGDRVAYAMERGAYAEYALVPAWKLVHVPEDIGLDTAAAVMLQGMTAHYLTHSTYPLQQGQSALVHAAAGGVGLLLVQVAKRLGARVIGTTSTEEKARLAREAGADDVVIYTNQDFVTAARHFGGGHGVDVVYDSVGKATFEGSLNALKRRGMLVMFGQSSGSVPPFDLGVLARRGSLFLPRASLVDSIAGRDELLSRARDVFSWSTAGEPKARLARTLPLEGAAEGAASGAVWGHAAGFFRADRVGASRSSRCRPTSCPPR